MIKFKILPVLAASLLLIPLYLVFGSPYFFGVDEYKVTGVYTDACIGIAASLIIYLVLRKIWLSVFAAPGIVIAFFVAADRYQAMFSRPLSGYDISPSMILDSLGFLSWTDILIAAVPVTALILLIDFRIKRLIRTLSYGALFSAFAYMGSFYLHSPYDQGLVGEDLASREGRISYVAKTSIERSNKLSTLSDRTKDAWTGHYQTTQSLLGSADQSDRPNVYVIVLESFYDFSNSNFPASALPWYDRYKQEVQPFVSSASSSVSGGMSVNTQFEVLCGVPSQRVVELLDFYMLKKIQDPDCLLDVVDGLGYQRAAINAGSPHYFYAGQAYDSLNFDSVEFLDPHQEEFDFTDVASDEELFEKLVSHDKAKPTLMYGLGLYGHYPFYGDPESQPMVVHDDALVDEHKRILSQEYYRQKYIVDFLDRIKKEDPESVVIITSDHTPGSAHKIDGKKIMVDEHSVPLIVYDRGEMRKTEGVELFEVHQLVFDLITDGNFCASKNDCYETERSSTEAKDLYFSFASQL